MAQLPVDDESYVFRCYSQRPPDGVRQIRYHRVFLWFGIHGSYPHNVADQIDFLTEKISRSKVLEQTRKTCKKLANQQPPLGNIAGKPR